MMLKSLSGLGYQAPEERPSKKSLTISSRLSQALMNGKANLLKFRAVLTLFQFFAGLSYCVLKFSNRFFI